MILGFLFRTLAVVASFWTDVFVLPAFGVSESFWTTAAALAFLARGLPQGRAAALGAAAGMLFSLVGTLPAVAYMAAGAAAGWGTAWVSRMYLSQRSLVSMAGLAFLCAAAFWSPALIRAFLDAVRGADPGAFAAAMRAVFLQAAATAALSVPLVLVRRAADVRIHRLR